MICENVPLYHATQSLAIQAGCQNMFSEDYVAWNEQIQRAILSRCIKHDMNVLQRERHDDIQSFGSSLVNLSGRKDCLKPSSDHANSVQKMIPSTILSYQSAMMLQKRDADSQFCTLMNDLFFE